MTEQEFWEQIFIKLLDKCSVSMALSEADEATKGWEKRFSNGGSGPFNQHTLPFPGKK